MAKEPKRITIAPGNDAASLLDEAAMQPLLLEKDGRTYRLEAESAATGWPAPDPEIIREGLQRTAGSWSELDIDAEIAKVYEAREAGSRPADRP